HRGKAAEGLGEADRLSEPAAERAARLLDAPRRADAPRRRALLEPVPERRAAFRRGQGGAAQSRLFEALGSADPARRMAGAGRDLRRARRRARRLDLGARAERRARRQHRQGAARGADCRDGERGASAGKRFRGRALPGGLALLRRRLLPGEAAAPSRALDRRGRSAAHRRDDQVPGRDRPCRRGALRRHSGRARPSSLPQQARADVSLESVTALDIPSFEPRAPWLTGDLQTLRGWLLRRDAALRPWPGERIVLPLGDGDSLVGTLHRPAEDQRKLLVVLVHGLSGCETSSYIVESAANLLAGGWPVLRLNLRGAGPARALCRGYYHAGRTEDLRAALAALPAPMRASGIVLVGYSLGGNLVLKLLGEGAPPGVVAAASISAPIDLAAAA